MRIEKPEIVITFPNCIGGVASFNRNIINFSTLKNQCSVRVILIRSKEDSRAPFEDKINADEVIHFDYSNKENQFFVCKRLHKLLGNSPGAIVTDNALTLNSIAQFSTNKLVVSLVHDYYYVKLSLQFSSCIDLAIVHSSFFKDVLFAANPTKFSSSAIYIPYGVAQPENLPQKGQGKLRLVFLGRLTKSKGVHLLRSIEDLLEKRRVTSQWTIIGKGPMEKELKQHWSGKNNCRFISPATTEGVYMALKDQDILVLPTFFEGTPVSILESISHGVVPVVSDLPGGIRDIVAEEIGFRCQLNQSESFSSAIIRLHENRDLLRSLQNNCQRLGSGSYDIQEAADRYFQEFLKLGKLSSLVTSKKGDPQFSRLDSKVIPNQLVKILRSLK